MKKAAIYFGTFDPIHDLHIMIAEFITQGNGGITDIDELVFFPDRYITDNYKSKKSEFHHRQNMISNAIGENKNKKLKTTYNFEDGYLNNLQNELETSHSLIEKILSHPKSKGIEFTFVFGADTYHKFRDEWTDGKINWLFR